MEDNEVNSDDENDALNCETENILPEDDCNLSKNDSVFNLSSRTDNVSSDALVEDLSFIEDDPGSPVPQNSSTPGKPAELRQSPRLRARALARAASPVPASTSQPTPQLAQSRAIRAKAKRSAPKTGRLKCPKCPSDFANKKTLDTHLRTHVLKGVASRAPNLQDLLMAMERLVKEVLEEIAKERVIGDLSDKVNKYAGKILLKLNEEHAKDDTEELYKFLSYHFFDIIRDSKILFPSSIRSAFNIGQNKLMSSEEFMTELNGILSSLEETEVDVCNVFIGNVMLILCKKIQIFCIRHMREVSAELLQPVQYKKRSKDSINSVKFHQLVYYIGGSVVGGFLWKGKEYGKTSAVWNRYFDVLTAKFCVNTEKTNQCVEEVREFTERKDRGGLTHLCEESFSFFLVLFDQIMSLEGEDGSFPQKIIDENILGSDVLLCLWDCLVGNELNQDDSIDLLVQVSDTCLKIVKKGILKRRLNKHLQKPVNSLALRKRLAA
ncbi:Protein Wiz [Frankliniella fusca]|uniref:Protein Wiz n=1 Tax=Frankliniella fusca TaxID=407009 RepID=A0AAE1HN96_9NEOP|nr:Protein Wiz [Frankliniella fusca]